MMTVKIIERVIFTVGGIAVWGNAIHSLIIGFRHGFRIPRALHWISATLLTIEVVVLVVFPVDFRTITLLLSIIIMFLPVSPYAAWVISGGPARRQDEQMKRELAQPSAGGDGVPPPQP